MENRNYKVNIRNVYVGLVQKINKSRLSLCEEMPYINFEDGLEGLKREFQHQSFFLKKDSDFILYDDPTTSRSMLFTLDENRHANDLLYDSPHYPIFNMSSTEDCLNSKFCIIDWGMSELYLVLKLFGYPDEIGYDEILEIRKTIFSCDFIMNNCRRLGVVETGPRETCFCLLDSTGKYRTFNETIEVYPLTTRGFFDSIIATKDCYEKGVIIDKFKPCEEEGPIKSLGTLKRD